MSVNNIFADKFEFLRLSAIQQLTTEKHDAVLSASMHGTHMVSGQALYDRDLTHFKCVQK